MATAEGTFSLDRFDAEDPYDDHDGVKIARAHISKTFAGDLAGTSPRRPDPRESPADLPPGLFPAIGPDGGHSYVLTYEL